ncbi:MAG: DUF2293 domain-containing protein [Actinomycetota bacterium]
MGPTLGEDILVFLVRRETECVECGAELWRGSAIRLEESGARCLACADLDHLVFLPRGDMALTRRATRHTGLRAVVVQWNRTRRRYERQGVLIEETALARAEKECLSDAEQREARRRREEQYRERRDQRHVETFARAVRDRYPGCPLGEELEIAGHACEKYSGRVGRSAAAKELDPGAIDLAVCAHVRHRHTRYDDHLMAGSDRGEARSAVAADVDHVLADWRRGEDSARRLVVDREPSRG